MPAVISKWTARRRATLQRLLEQGLSYREVARRMHETPTAVRGAAQRYGMMRPERLVRGQPWAREDFDRLEGLLAEGLGFEEIARRMGRTYNGIRCAVDRLGLTDRERWRHRLRDDWPEIERIAEACIEVERMCIAQVAQRLAALGYIVTPQALHARMREHHPELHRQAVQFAEHRRQQWRHIHGKRRARRARQQEAS
ncbi:hypothetical protein [Halomonas koreensis]|uniref:Homeodomain-like domain-containing protein n=1 Tax=Halomonas koreensis TaxID=245385 RepID=A0ABU1G2Y0_9GAMM|nr:hypothetical protein [Halomonas koreensis]MDR5867260.1 hypothetical protein [Halomonas koreensis]